jgi:prepilin-type N-terminal cleavage/methylation domain-containing protein
MKFSRHAFTLIELLVVIGIIAVIAGGIGLALGKGEGGLAVQNGQGILSSSISTARSVAALKQTTAGLYLNVDPNSDGFLREVRIGYAAAVDDDGDPITPNVAVRIQRGDSILLPRGVYIVPRQGALTGGVQYATGWDQASFNSELHIATNVPLKQQNGTTAVDGTFHLLVEFDGRGNPKLGSGNRIILGPAVSEAGEPLSFERSETVRALILSRYGFVSQVNDQAAL